MMKRGRVIQAVEAALNGHHDGCPRLPEGTVREILMILREFNLHRTTVEWSEEDYRRARDCMLGILRNDAWTIDIGGEAWFDNAFQHAVGILSVRAAKAEDQATAKMTNGYNRLRDALSWFSSHEVEKKLGHLPQWVVMGRELTNDEKECPVGPNWSLWNSCPVCGALGPWFENGECVDTERAEGRD